MNSDDPARTIELDIRGQICPSSLLTTLQEVNSNRRELKDGKALIRVKTDNRDATVTIPETAKRMGYHVSTVRQDDYYEITILKPRR